MQVGAGPPFRNPPSVWDIWGASGASLRVFGAPWGSPGKQLTRSGQAFAYLAPAMQVGAGPPFRAPPPSRGRWPARAGGGADGRRGRAAYLPAPGFAREHRACGAAGRGPRLRVGLDHGPRG